MILRKPFVTNTFFFIIIKCYYLLIFNMGNEYTYFNYIFSMHWQNYITKYFKTITQ